jgi:predicted anti-sigma-YlaC factor YlaD
MRCSEVQDRWAALLDRRLGEADRGRVEEHLLGCVSCEREHQALLAAERLLQRHAQIRVAPPEGLIDRLMERLQARPRRTIVLELFRMAAVAVLLVAVFSLLLGRLSSPMVEDVSSRVEDTRHYVTEELPRAIGAGVQGIWRSGRE